jgi:hypothetical protein
MANEFEAQLGTSEEYQSVNEERLKAAREAGNVWNFAGTELEMFVARGYIESATEIINPSTQAPTGAMIIHKFGWDKAAPFIARERAFKTSLTRVGRSSKQKVKTTQLIPVNAELYAALIQGGTIRRMENGEAVDLVKSREEMLDFARLYPEAASEAIETWLDSGKCKLLGENYNNDFNWIFSNLPVKKVLWYIGDEENPDVAAILTFNSPPKEEREKFDDDVQNIESEKKGDVNFAELSENFATKVQFGIKYLSSVEGAALKTEGNVPTFANSKEKEEFIVLFNPIWFADAVETMLEAFNFTKGKSKTS